MDRVILISVESGMLLFEQSFSPSNSNDQDSMQLASIFAALQHAKASISLQRQPISISIPSNISLYEQGSSVWVTSSLSHRHGEFIVALFNRNARFSFDFWRVIVECVSKELLSIHLDKCSDSATKKLFIKAISNAFEKSIAYLPNLNLTFPNTTATAKLSAALCQISSQVSKLLNDQGQQSSSKVLSPTKKVDEARPTRETVSPTRKNPANSGQTISTMSASPPPSSSSSSTPTSPSRGSGFCCWRTTSTVSVAKEEPNLVTTPAKQTPMERNIVYAAVPDSEEPLSTGIAAPTKALSSVEHFYVTFSNQSMQRIGKPVLTLIGDRYSIPFQKEKRVPWPSFYDLNEANGHLSIIDTFPSIEKAALISDRSLSATSNNDLQIVSIEDDSPRKAPKPSSMTSESTEIKMSSNVVALDDGCALVFNVSRNSSDSLSSIINLSTVQEIATWIKFCATKGWLRSFQDL